MSIPELGTIAAVRRPIVVLTSNTTRELSEALKRRCLYLHLDYPDLEREKAIVRVRVPEIGEQLAEQLVRIVRSLRELELRKAPSISETLDWARTLLALRYDTIGAPCRAAACPSTPSSAASAHTDATVECRNLRQLAEFIATLA